MAVIGSIRASLYKYHMHLLAPGMQETLAPGIKISLIRNILACILRQMLISVGGP